MAKETRLNGAAKWLITLGVIIFAVGGGWALKASDVKDNTVRSKASEADLTLKTIEIAANTERSKVNETDIKEMDKSFHKVEKEVSEMRVEQREFRSNTEKTLERIEKKL